jgi:hypothetical protein
MSAMGLSRAYDSGCDIEGDGDGYPKQSETLESSLGWWPLPKVRLATWDPHDEKQWLVSTAVPRNHCNQSELY